MKENKSYEIEFSTNKILENMLHNTFNNFKTYNPTLINKEYLNIRNSLFNILQKITMKFGFKSQTFFLTAYYLDIIFIKRKKININLYKIGLACLCISSKFCENDPIVPHLQYFIKAYNSTTGFKNFISKSELMNAEVVVCKILKYKLNYFSAYDFIAFFFCHGIFKFDQIKEIQQELNINNKNINEGKDEKSDLDTNLIKNILGKIYRTVRNYLDIIIKIDRICMKYNPLYIAIYLIEISMIECLGNEYKKRKGNMKTEEIEREMNNFSNKNKIYFKEVMNEFYKIYYEDNEQYIQLLKEDEVISIFEKGKKNNKKLNIENNIDKENMNKLFRNTVTHRFYKRLKLPLDNDKIGSSNKDNKDINKQNNNNENKENNLEMEEDLDSNLNIDDFRKKMNTKNNNIPIIKKFKKISMNKINLFDKIDNKKALEIKTEKFKPIKFSKSKIYNFRNTDVSLKINNSTALKTMENNKKYYKKKLISGSDRNIFKSFHESIKSSTSTNFYNNKFKRITQNENNKESGRTSYYQKVNIKDKENSRIMNTAETKRYKKIIPNKNQLSLKGLRIKKIFKDKFDNGNLSKRNFNKISVNTSKSSIDSEFNKSNIKKEHRTKKLLFSFHKNNSELNNNFKDTNKTHEEKIFINEYKNKINTTINNNNDSLNDKAIKYKKISYNKINDDYTLSKSNKKSEIKKIIFKKKQNDNSIKEGYSFKTLNNINNNQTKQKQFKTVNKDSSLNNSNQNNTNNQPLFSSFYNIIQRTKKLFNKGKGNNEVKNRDNKNIDSNKKEEVNKSFFKSQRNFYNKEKKIKENNSKEKEIKNMNTIIINNNININIENKKDIKIPELNFNNTIITSDKNNNFDKIDGNNNGENIKSFAFKNIFQKFNFNKNIINKSSK